MQPSVGAGCGKFKRWRNHVGSSNAQRWTDGFEGGASRSLTCRQARQWRYAGHMPQFEACLPSALLSPTRSDYGSHPTRVYRWSSEAPATEHHDFKFQAFLTREPFVVEPFFSTFPALVRSLIRRTGRLPCRTNLEAPLALSLMFAPDASHSAQLPRPAVILCSL